MAPSTIDCGGAQENGRAKVVGETTFGKGLVQTIAPLQVLDRAIVIVDTET